MKYLGVQIGKRPDLRTAGYGAIEVVSSLIKVLSLGLLFPTWEMILMQRSIERQIAKRAAAQAAKALTTDQ